MNGPSEQLYNTIVISERRTKTRTKSQQLPFVTIFISLFSHPTFFFFSFFFFLHILYAYTLHTFSFSWRLLPLNDILHIRYWVLRHWKIQNTFLVMLWKTENGKPIIVFSCYTCNKLNKILTICVMRNMKYKTWSMKYEVRNMKWIQKGKRRRRKMGISSKKRESVSKFKNIMAQCHYITFYTQMNKVISRIVVVVVVQCTMYVVQCKNVCNGSNNSRKVGYFTLYITSSLSKQGTRGENYTHNKLLHYSTHNWRIYNIYFDDLRERLTRDSRL